MENKLPERELILPLSKLGIGGISSGLELGIEADLAIQDMLSSAWSLGIRYFDTSPSYGNGLGEIRTGSFLNGEHKDDYTISTKIGFRSDYDNRLSRTNKAARANPFSQKIGCYTALEIRRCIDRSLHRLGAEVIDIIFIEESEISRVNSDLSENFQYPHWEAAAELESIREEGIIKNWGISSGNINLILEYLKRYSPDYILLVSQYSLIDHVDALSRLFPICIAQNVNIIIGAPLNGGFLTGKPDYNYSSKGAPKGALERLKSIGRIAERYQVDLLTASLHFCAAPALVKAVICGARNAGQLREIVDCFSNRQIPMVFWEELKANGLIAEFAPIPQLDDVLERELFTNKKS